MIKELKILIYSKTTKNYFDIFYNRIIFPIKNIQGQIIGFGGRTLENKEPKYLNSPENIFFHKRNELYGLYEIKKKFHLLEKILVVEGYTDVISLFQFNIKYVVAILGISITNEHIKKLFQITNKIIYCYDGDNAGRKANWHSLKISLSHMVHGKQINFLLLPDGEDPDSLIKKEGKILFEKHINNSLSFSDFFFKVLINKINLKDCEGKTKFINIALSLIHSIPDYIFQVNLIKKIGEKIGILNFFEIYQLTIKKKNIKKLFNNDYLSNFRKTTVRMLISLLLQKPELIKIIPKLKLFKTSNINGLNFFVELIKICNKEKITTVQILERYRGTKFKKPLEILAVWNHMVPEEEIENFFIHLINKLKMNLIEERQEYLIFLDRKEGLDLKKKKELWSLNKNLVKIKKNF
ncbi:toprim domain-containing protein [Enterobacteriaceae endosymbiont of Plateumaris braccata]|uniref:DNA primase n=1 Tax=Enterobacteriaceae endosymbiont of Plateumaris braccata TaxID=2675793 RepID=UPI0014490344|nr:toprim domain-containing protein [Enterobacteriaceae endosymbiont of Plateumaris braccata]QJC28194.1 toprim domain-containing protein [Enterobacteriaceae endosymbiont of Plateumaris braccata]